MKPSAMLQRVAIAAAALVLASCGGGGGGPPAGSVQLTGFAATGSAMAGAAVTAKCGSGSGGGSATADSWGSYTITIAGGALPCILRASLTHGNTPHQVYSLAEAGSTDVLQVTRATAHVTPVTEMVVAHLAQALPSAWFDDFTQARRDLVTSARLQASTAAVLAALRDGAGIDFGAIDPFRGELVPATGTNAPDRHDQLLEQVTANLNPQAFTHLLHRIASARSAPDLQDALLAVSGGSLANCEAALSGKYRTLDYTGRLVMRTINFKNGTFSATDGGTLAIIPSDACSFTARGPEGGATVLYELTLADSGVGAYTSRVIAPISLTGSVGYLFPAQSHALPALTGTDWRYVQSGYQPGVSDTHYVGGMVIGADRSVSRCQVALGDWSCDPAGTPALTIAERGDGGFDLKDGAATVLQVYGFRPLHGGMVLFGTSDVAGGPNVHVVATALETLPLPVVGSVHLTHEMTQTAVAGPGQSSQAHGGVETLAVDAATGAVTRKRLRDNQVEVVRYNHPVPGVRHRPATTDQQDLMHLPLADLGLTVEFNTAAPPTGSYFYNIVVRDR